MKIALCVKQVPDTQDIKWTENNTMQREGVESILNPYDVYATELALKLKKEYGANITAISMGPNQAKDMLKGLVALGVDDAVLVSDKKFAGADTFATGKTLSAAINKIMPDFDLIICGQFAIDGDTAQTGPCIAGLLDIPQATYTREVEGIANGTATVIRELDDGDEKVEIKIPALLAVVKTYDKPSRAKIDGIIKAQNTEIKTITLEDLGLSSDEVGIKGSPTYVSKAFKPESKHSRTKYTANCAEVVLNKIREVIANE